MCPAVANSCRLKVAAFTIVAEQPHAGHEAIADALYEIGSARVREQQRRQRAAQVAAQQQQRDALPFRNAAELKSTEVLPHPGGVIIPGRNSLYCATFQLAWREWIDKVVREAPLLAGDPPMARALNQQHFDQDDLSPESYLVQAGPRNESFRELLRDKLCERFPESQLPLLTLPEQVDKKGVLIYAYLRKQLRFAHDFERLEVGLEFRNETTSGRVRAFGVREFDERMHETLGKQVTILSYRNDRDFIVKLETQPAGDEIVLAKVTPQATLADTLADVQERIDCEADRFKRRRLEVGESLAIPILDLKVWRDYPELIGRPLQNPGREGQFIESAIQAINFRLDEAGAVLESAALLEATLGLEIGEPPPPRKLLFDRPFLVFLKEQRASQPYLAAWIDNDEFMEASKP